MLASELLQQISGCLIASIPVKDLGQEKRPAACVEHAANIKKKQQHKTHNGSVGLITHALCSWGLTMKPGSEIAKPDRAAEHLNYTQTQCYLICMIKTHAIIKASALTSHLISSWIVTRLPWSGDFGNYNIWLTPTNPTSLHLNMLFCLEICHIVGS